MSVEELYRRVQKLSESYKSISDPEFVKSGSVVLDALLGGGIPKGTFITWSSENGCGKSTGALHISKVYCMQGKRVLYLDFEGGVNLPQVNSMGLSEYLYGENNPEGLFILFQAKTYRDAEIILDEMMESVDLVVIDSITAVLTEKIKGSSSEDSLPGADARVMSTFLKKYKADAARWGTTWIIINQMRTKLSFMGNSGDVEAGGHALKFYPDIRLQMKKTFKGDLEREEETANGVQKVPFGAICDIYARKNRYERPFIPLRLAIIFGKGIDNNYAYYDFLTDKGCIKKSGAWFTINVGDESAKVQGMYSVIEWIGSHKDTVKKYIDSEGGFKLLLNESKPLDLGISSTDEEGVYDQEVITEKFDQLDVSEDEKTEPLVMDREEV